MNLDQIAARIAEPNTCQGTEINALKELTEKYPFAQVFSILYLKALSNQNDIGFDEALQQHAYKVTDRMKLYDLIHGNVPDSHVETQPEEVPAPVAAPAYPVALPEEADFAEGSPIGADLPEVAAAPVAIEQREDAVVDSAGEDLVEEVADPARALSSDLLKAQDEIPEMAEDLQEFVEENADPGNVPVSPPAVGDDLNTLVRDELELEIISQVVATVYNDNLEHSITEKPVEEKKQETLITPVPASEAVVKETKRSFSSWLKAGNQVTSPPAQAAVPQAEKISKEPEKQVDKIIEKFIEQEPTISRPKKEFYSPTKKAKESISAEGLIYTETLAEIFAIQGNFPKAIVAYEQLMLTNPEKKIFFAQRIKELKEKLNT